jgi:hypothetical protein
MSRWRDELYQICKGRNLADDWIARWLVSLTAQVHYPTEALERARPDSQVSIEREVEVKIGRGVVALYGRYQWQDGPHATTVCSGNLLVLKDAP